MEENNKKRFLTFTTNQDEELKEIMEENINILKFLNTFSRLSSMYKNDIEDCDYELGYEFILNRTIKDLEDLILKQQGKKNE